MTARRRKRCSVCGDLKKTDQFSLLRGGDRSTRCKACTSLEATASALRKRIRRQSMPQLVRSLELAAQRYQILSEEITRRLN